MSVDKPGLNISVSAFLVLCLESGKLCVKCSRVGSGSLDSRGKRFRLSICPREKVAQTERIVDEEAGRGGDEVGGQRYNAEEID